MFDYRWRYFDFYMLATTAMLMGFGVIAVWSASGADAPTLLNPGVKQAMFGAIGIALMLIIANTDYRFIGALAWPAYFLAIAGADAVKFARRRNRRVPAVVRFRVRDRCSHPSSARSRPRSPSPGSFRRAASR